MQGRTIRNPTGPIVTKFQPEVLQIRAKLQSLSHLKRPNDIQLMEGERLQKVGPGKHSLPRQPTQFDPHFGVKLFPVTWLAHCPPRHRHRFWTIVS